MFQISYAFFVACAIPKNLSKCKALCYICNKLIFYRELLVCGPTSILEEHLLSAVHFFFSVHHCLILDFSVPVLVNLKEDL